MDVVIYDFFVLSILVSFSVFFSTIIFAKPIIVIKYIDIAIVCIIIMYCLTMITMHCDVRTKIICIGYCSSIFLYFSTRILTHQSKCYKYESYVLSIFGISFVIAAVYIIYRMNMCDRATLHNQNHFACYIVLGIPIIMSMLLGLEKKGKNYILLPILLLLIYAVIITKSRASYLSLIIVLPLIVIAHYNNFKKIRKYIIYVYSSKRFFFISLLFLLLPLLVYTLYRMKPFSFFGRLLIWRVTLNAFFKYPLKGIGFGNLANSYTLFQSEYFTGYGSALQKIVAGPSRHAYNWYLETAAESGIMGIIIFGIFWFLVLKHVWIVFYAHLKGISNDYITLGIAGSILCFLIMSFFHFHRKILPIYMLFNFMLAWIVSKSQSKNYIKIRSQYFRFFHYGLVGILIMFSLWFLPKYFKWYIMGREWKKAQELACNSNYVESLNLYSNAYKSLDWNGRFCAYYGDALMQSYNQSIKTMSNLYLGTNEYQVLNRAIRLYERAKYTWPDPFMFEHLGYAYAEIGRPEGAIIYWQLSSNILPWRLTPKYYLADLFYQLSDTNNAIKYARLVVNTPMKKWTERGKEFKLKSQKMLVKLGQKCDDPGLVVFDINDKKTWNEGEW